MLKATIHDLEMFENFLNVINRFVQQCEFDLHTDKVNVFCSNQRDFSSSRLLLDSNVITLDENQKIDHIKIYIRDVIAFKSAISIVRDVEGINKIQILLDDVENDLIYDDSEKILVKSIKYKGKKGGKFNLITVDKSVILNYISKELTRKLEQNLIFNIIPKNLDILQNKTNNIVNISEVSVYIYPDTAQNNIILDLNSKQSSSTNSISLPISNGYKGSLEGFPYKEIAIHESAFRILNILRTTNEENLKCFFNIENNVFFIESEISSKDNDDYKIHSRLLIQMIKGK